MKNSTDRMPKKDYFQMRFEDALANGNEDKANYYLGRLEQLKDSTNPITKAIEAVIDARNYGYRDCKADISIEVTKEETESYTTIKLKGYDSAKIAVHLESILSAAYSFQIHSNNDVTISIRKD